MKQVYINNLVGEVEFTHDYNIINKEENVFLYRSDSSQWSDHTKNKLVLTIEDNGNGIVVKFEGHKKFSIDYAQAQELFVLMLHAQDTQVEFRESKTILKWPS